MPRDGIIKAPRGSQTLWWTPLLDKMTEWQQKGHCLCLWGQTGKQAAIHNALTSEVKHTKEGDFRLAVITTELWDSMKIWKKMRHVDFEVKSTLVPLLGNLNCPPPVWKRRNFMDEYTSTTQSQLKSPYKWTSSLEYEFVWYISDFPSHISLPTKQ